MLCFFEFLCIKREAEEALRELDRVRVAEIKGIRSKDSASNPQGGSAVDGESAS
ncbi:MAG: hypothetical protein ABDH16_08320 [Thermodesulfovibrionaceae bacterium]